MTFESLPRMPLQDRPLFARRMIAVWRLHHLSAGEELKVRVHSGEWPDGHPAEVKSVPVVEDDVASGGPGGVLVLGRIGDVWRAAFNVAVDLHRNTPAAELAIVSAYMEVTAPRAPLRIWMHPDPRTGEVPMWEFLPRGAR